MFASNPVACVLQFKCENISSARIIPIIVLILPNFLFAHSMVRRHPAARGVGRSRSSSALTDRRRLRGTIAKTSDGCEGKSGGCDTAGSPQR